jgi:deoxyribonuclease-4
MLRLGAHESIAGHFYRAVDRAQSVGCDAVQIFVKPNRAWAFNSLTEADVVRFRARVEETGIRPVVGHASYLLNLASPDEELWRRSRDTLIEELKRCQRLGAIGLVLHLGSHVGTGERAGLARAAQALGQVHMATPEVRAQILLETTAGQGDILGYRFEQLAWMLENTPQGDRLGICLDTCHVFAAGYDLRSPADYWATMAAFERTVGLGRLRALHLNDSRYGLGSRRDRHEHIGQGFIGLEGFRNVLNDPRLEGLPGLLETPKSSDLHEDAENLAVLRSLEEAAP